MNAPTRSNLAELAQRIDAEHSAARAALERGLVHAINAGERLIEAKSALDHGQWLGWLGANCEVSQRSAQLYMRAAAKFLRATRLLLMCCSAACALFWIRLLRRLGQICQALIETAV